jgi:hypothetical protein
VDNSGALVATGAGNAFAVTTEQTFTGYFDGLTLAFTANHSITGAATLDVNGIGAADLRKDGSAALVSGDIVSGQRVQVTHDGSNFQIMSRTVQAPVTDGTDTLTTRGDLLTRDASALARLAVGAANTFLGANGTDPAYVAAATQAEQVAGAALNKPVVPAVQHFHNGHAKAVVSFTANTTTPTITTLFNGGLGTLVSERHGDGEYTLSWDNALNNLFPNVQSQEDNTSAAITVITSTSIRVRVRNDTATLVDPTALFFHVFGVFA